VATDLLSRTPAESHTPHHAEMLGFKLALNFGRETARRRVNGRRLTGQLTTS